MRSRVNAQHATAAHATPITPGRSDGLCSAHNREAPSAPGRTSGPRLRLRIAVVRDRISCLAPEAGWREHDVLRGLANLTWRLRRLASESMNLRACSLQRVVKFVD